jgi:hypothetical protein
MKLVRGTCECVYTVVVCRILEKVIPANTTLRSYYEEFIVPFLTKVVKSQTRKYKNVKRHTCLA